MKTALDNPNFMDAVRDADAKGVLPEFLEAVTKQVKRSNKVLEKERHAAQALEKLNRMRRARGMPEVTSL